jgi:hypothetical protein
VLEMFKLEQLQHRIIITLITMDKAGQLLPLVLEERGVMSTTTIECLICTLY